MMVDKKPRVLKNPPTHRHFQWREPFFGGARLEELEPPPTTFKKTLIVTLALNLVVSWFLCLILITEFLL